MFNVVYGRIWPFVFLAFGILAASDQHLHWELWGFSLNLHSLMWFIMAAAHADRLWSRPRSNTRRGF